MGHKSWLIAGGALLGLLLTLPAGSGFDWESLSAPFFAAGTGLRVLSLSGFWGNLAAWGITLVICALPLLLLWRSGPSRKMEDWLLVLTSPLLFALFYFLVNPTHLSGAAAAFFPLATAGTILSLLLAWFILKLLRGLNSAPTDRLAHVLKLLMTGCAIFAAAAVVYGQAWQVRAQWAQVQSGNTGAVGFTLFILLLLGVLNVTPGLLAALTLLWGAELADTLGRSVFGAEAVSLCQRTAAGCQIVVQATLLLSVCTNLLQLVLMERLHSTHFSVSLPLLPLLLSVGMFLLCRCFQKGRDLQEDSDSII